MLSFKLSKLTMSRHCRRFSAQGKDITSSTDEVEDKLERDGFVRKYQEMHRLVSEPDKTTVLYVGAEKTGPFPIPLVAEKRQMAFSIPRPAATKILCRRIGDNEAMTLGAFRLPCPGTAGALGKVPVMQILYLDMRRVFIGVKGDYNGLDWQTDGALPEALVKAGVSDQGDAN